MHDHPALGDVKKVADQHFSGKEYNIKKETRAFHPHITIATRDLHKKSFAEAWPSYQNKKFTEEWVANGLSVLKHNGTRWDVIHTSLFNEMKKF